MDNIDSSIMKHFHVLQICIFQTIILNRQGWPDFLTTWVRIRNFLSIMLLRLPCYSAYWWVVKAFFEVVRGSVSVWCEQSPLLGRLLNQQQAAGKWFHCKVLNILTSFPWSITVETMKNCCRFVVYNNVDSFDIHFLWNFLKSCAHKTDGGQIWSPSHHFHGLYVYQTKLSTNQCTRNHSVIVKWIFLTIITITICKYI